MHMKLGALRALLCENVQNIIVYHTSSDPELVFESSRGAWFAPTIELAKAYHANVEDDLGEAYTYRCSIHGCILIEDELKQTRSELGIDYDDYAAGLTSGPSSAGQDQETQSIMQRTGCDGFMHTDYDPRDYNRDVLSIFVIDPGKNVSVLEAIDVKEDG